MSNCGGISCHGEGSCFVTMKEGEKSECKCVNPPDFDCTLYFKLGTSAFKHKPYLRGHTTWIKWGASVCDEFPDHFRGLNSETQKKQFRFALDYTKKALNLTPATAGVVETHPNITPFFKLYRKIYEEQEKDELETKLGDMLGAAKQDSMLTFEANILSPVTTTRSISGILSASLSSKRSSTPLSQQLKDFSPNSENLIRMASLNAGNLSLQ